MRRNARISKRWLLPAALFLLAAVLTGVLLLDGGGQQSGPPGQTRPFHPPNQTQPQLRPIPTQPESEETLPSLPEPEETTAPTEMTEPEDPGQDWEPIETDPPETQPQEPEPVDTDLLRCRQYARFTGQYVEDGRDELVENVAAILVTNKSDQFLDLATLTYDIDGQTASFIVTGLPAGRSAWVMEANRMVIPDDAVFTFVETVTSFRSDVIVETKELSIYADANMLTAVNNTDGTLEDVFVYYKTLHTDGNFFGGITYRVDFGTLEPGASAQTLAGHYRSGETELVRVGWAGQ